MPMDLGVRCMAIETNPDGSTKRVFAQLSSLNGFSVIDIAQQKEVARIKLPGVPQEFDSGGYRDNEPSHGIGVAPDNKTLWVTSIPNNAVFVYSLADLKLIGEVALPALKLPGHDAIASVPNWVTFTPDSKTIYISNAAIKSVTAIDTESRTVKAVVPVGEVPKRITTLVAN
jgi:YVTN family beta-propeller protein